MIDLMQSLDEYIISLQYHITPIQKPKEIQFDDFVFSPIHHFRIVEYQSRSNVYMVFQRAI